MAKVDPNPISDPFHGRVGTVVFRRVNGKLFASYIPKPSSVPPTPDQLAQREVFGEAAQWGKIAAQNPAIVELYRRVAAEKQMNQNAIAIADWFNAPSVKTIDASAYHCQIGDKIAITAVDDVAVQSVSVAIRHADGTIAEEGPAVLLNGKWIYTATTAIALAPGATLMIDVTAMDWPGHIGKGNKIYP